MSVEEDMTSLGHHYLWSSMLANQRCEGHDWMSTHIGAFKEN